MSKLVIPGVIAQSGNGGGGGSYVLPTATANRLGGIKVGENLTVEADGTLNAQAGGAPQNTNPLEKITCEEDNVVYATITIDESEIELEAPYFDSLSEEPTAPLHFIGILPAEYADSGTTWEYEIVQYKANEAWYHLIGTDMVFCIERDAEIEDILMEDTIYPLEAMLPNFHKGSTGNKQLIQKDNSDGAIKWVTDNKLENTATGTNALTVNGNATTGAFAINIGYNSEVFGATTVALGATASAINDGAISIGYGASASPRYTIAIGSFAKANASGSGDGGGVAIGAYAEAKAKKAIAIGGYDSTSSTSDVPKATAESAIQLGQGTNNTAKTLQVYEYPLLDGNTGKIPAERLPDVFANIQKAANFNVVGSISIDYDWVASNFSTARYLIGPNNPTVAITSAQFDLKIKTPSSLSGDNFRCMLGQSAHNFYTPQIDFIGNEFHFRVSTDGTSWKDVAVTGQFSTNTDYYIRGVFDGTKLQAFKSANGVDYTQIGSDVPCSSMYWAEQMLIGLDTDAGGDLTGAWTGSIYLEDLSIKINGQDYWKAVNFMNSNLTLYPGYDGTKTQVLKNVNGTLTWVDEA